MDEHDRRGYEDDEIEINSTISLYNFDVIGRIFSPARPFHLLSVILASVSIITKK